MIRPDEETLRALVSLEGNGNFKRVTVWLETSREHAERSCAALRDDIALRWAQGGCQELHSLLAHIETARDALEEQHKPEKGGMF